MDTLIVFVGTAKTKDKGIYSLSLYVGGEMVMLPPKSVKTKAKISEDLLTLMAVRDFLDAMTKEKARKSKIDFYISESSELCSEWDSYLNGAEHSDREHQDILDDISGLIKNSDFEITINQSHKFSEINKIQSRKSKKALRGAL